MIAILDCGTTNTKCYIVNRDGTLLSEKCRNFGVKDNSLLSDRNDYKTNIKKIVEKSVKESKRPIEELECVVGFGMISSDLGLIVVPHAIAPVNIKNQQDNVYLVDDNLFGNNVKFYLIRGIKNPLENEKSISNIEKCDFMRGEETQVVGIYEKFKPTCDFNVLMFGSHLKIINVSKNCDIRQSMTTMSGQIYDCLVNHTVIGKSVKVDENKKMNMCIDEIIDLADETVKARGLMRAFLLPRFMESFTDMTAIERLNYLDAVIALEDIKAIQEYINDGLYSTKKYYFIGQKARCELFKNVVLRSYKDADIEILDNIVNRDISIIAALKILEKII